MSQIASRTLLALTLIAAPAPFARAQSPSCDAANVGTVACFVSKLCACTFMRGGAMTGATSGYRWDCGVMRPGCGADSMLPATIDPYLGQLPSALSLDRNQTIINTQTGAGSSNQTLTGNRSAGTVVNQPTLPAQR
jgi:hypothetical protein